MKIKDARVSKIFDSRGNPTIEIALFNEGSRRFCAQIPSGASTGRREASVFRYPKAQAVVRGLRKKITGRTFASISAFDEFLLGFDGTQNKRRIGGNVALGMSIAFARALAFKRGEEVWQVVRKEF